MDVVAEGRKVTTTLLCLAQIVITGRREKDRGNQKNMKKKAKEGGNVADGWFFKKVLTLICKSVGKRVAKFASFNLISLAFTA